MSTDFSEKLADYLRKHGRNNTKLQEMIGILSKKIDEEYAVVKSYEEDRKLSPKLLFDDDFITKAKDTARSTLDDNFSNAVKKTKEFDYPAFRTLISKGLQDKNLINVGLDDTYKIFVDYFMEDVFGKLETYANSIMKYRQSLAKAKGKESTSAAVASVFWKEKVYKPSREGANVFNPSVKGFENQRQQYTGLYGDTIAGRMEFWGTESAPYWQLIDKGNVGVEMGSNRGGEPYPQYSATDFVRAAEIQAKAEIQESLDFLVEKRKETFNRNIKSSEKRIDIYSKYIDRVREIMTDNEIREREKREKIERNKLQPYEVQKYLSEREVVEQERTLIRSFVNELLRMKFGDENLRRANQQKLEQLVEDIRNNVPLPSRMSFGRTDMGKRMRPGLVRFVKSARIRLDEIRRQLLD